MKLSSRTKIDFTKDLLVIRPISKDMREAVDTPDNVDAEGIPKYRGNKKGVQPRLVPAVDWDYGGQHEAEDRHHFHVMPGELKLILSLFGIPFGLQICT